MVSHGEEWTAGEWADAIGVSREAIYERARTDNFFLKASVGGPQSQAARRKHARRVERLAGMLRQVEAEAPDSPPERRTDSTRSRSVVRQACARTTSMLGSETGLTRAALDFARTPWGPPEHMAILVERAEHLRIHGEMPHV
jgi:hypothetical protein